MGNFDLEDLIGTRVGRLVVKKLGGTYIKQYHWKRKRNLDDYKKWIVQSYNHMNLENYNRVV